MSVYLACDGSVDLDLPTGMTASLRSKAFQARSTKSSRRKSKRSNGSRRTACRRTSCEKHQHQHQHPSRLRLPLPALGLRLQPDWCPRRHHDSRPLLPIPRAKPRSLRADLCLGRTLLRTRPAGKLSTATARVAGTARWARLLVWACGGDLTMSGALVCPWQ